MHGLHLDRYEIHYQIVSDQQLTMYGQVVYHYPNVVVNHDHIYHYYWMMDPNMNIFDEIQGKNHFPILYWL